MRLRVTSRAKPVPNTSLAADFEAIDGKFSAAMRERGYAKHTIWAHRWHLKRIAALLCRQRRRLDDVQRGEAAGLLRKLMPDLADTTRRSYREPLNLWLKISGRYSLADRSAAWEAWVDDFIRFCHVHRGLCAGYVELLERGVRKYLTWQFGKGAADWRRVAVGDIWAFAYEEVKGRSPYAATRQLSYVRQFLTFVQLQGACSEALPRAVPRVAAYGRVSARSILSPSQRRAFLSSFPRRTAVGRRDCAIALCMLELGLRAKEVTDLCRADVDLVRRTLMVAAVKGGRARLLPLRGSVFASVRRYLQRDRPASSSDRLFLRHRCRHGQPMSRRQILSRTRDAYRRSGLPRSWSGTHRLRHTFASRLLGKGVSVKEISDFLGHRNIETTTIYLQTDLRSLRHIAQPWPVRA